MIQMTSSYPSPQPGALLLISLRLNHPETQGQGQSTVVLIGSGTSCAPRAFASLEAGAAVVILAPGGVDSACDELRYRAEHGQVDIRDEELGCFLEEERRTQGDLGYVRFVCVTDTTTTALCSQNAPRRTRESALKLYNLCKSYNILINVHDMPDLCDFTFPSTHRFRGSSLQLGVTTNGMGCRLAGRIKRQIVAALPKDVGDAVMNIGTLRKMAKERDTTPVTVTCSDNDDDDVIDDTSGPSTPNRPVAPRSHPKSQSQPTSSQQEEREESVERTRRRMKWVAQISEYYPLTQLARLTESQMDQILAGENTLPTEIIPPSSASSSSSSAVLDATPIPTSSVVIHSPHGLTLSAPANPKAGRIYLVGSGPGHPSLLTIATHDLLTKHATLVLADKLVPSQVLDIIPPHVKVRIARKFPGNAEGAQMEMMDAAVEAAKKGEVVVRLKQGDPSIYGRSGEEYIFLSSALPTHPPPLIIPGISSALAAPTFAGIPLTQRGVADSFVVCTGVGRGGKKVQLPGYKKERTLVVLMGVARIAEVIKALISPASEVDDSTREGKAYPSYLPIAIIERGSMPDQRVIKSTLEDIQVALESSGEQRPPGMIVIGWCVLALAGDEGVDVEAWKGEDEERVKVSEWLGVEEGVQRRWVVSEGVEDGWEGL